MKRGNTSPENTTESLDCRLKAVLAEYDDCRNEIKIRLQERTRMTDFYIVGVAAIASFAAQSGNYYLLLIASFYAVFMYAMITGTYFYTDALMTYIREEIELKKIPHLLDKVPAMASIGKAPAIEWTTQWLGWETNMADRRPTISRRKILRFFSWGIILISAIATGYSLFLSNIHIMLATFLALVILLAYGLAIEYIRRKESFLERYKKKSLTQL